MSRLSERSISQLAGVHPDLVAVVERAAELGARFHVTCGLRSIAEQRRLVAAGKSRTMKSRHLTGHAVDFVAVGEDGKVTWDHAAMGGCARVFKAAARDLGLPLEWGGDWASFVDTPHLQLPHKFYPADEPLPKTPRQLAAEGSRIAKGAIDNQKDAGKAGGAAGAELVIPPPPAGGVDLGLPGIAAQVGAHQGAAETLERFLVFAWGRMGWIGAALAIFFVGRMMWRSGMIGRWRAEDAATGKTVSEAAP